MPRRVKPEPLHLDDDEKAALEWLTGVLGFAYGSLNPMCSVNGIRADGLSRLLVQYAREMKRMDAPAAAPEVQ